MKLSDLRGVLAGLLGVLSLVSGLLVSDVVFDEPEVVLPVAEGASVMPTGDLADPNDPGAVLAPVIVDAVAPVFEDAAIVYPTTYDEQGNPSSDEPSSDSGQSAGSDGSPGGTAQPEALPPATGSVPGAAGEAMATIVRFLDLCADDPAGCPIGIGATVLFGNDPPLPPPIRVEVVPEAITALFPTLRCGPMWPTPTVIPVVLLSNRPFDTLHATLKSPDGSVLSQILNHRSGPKEFALYDQRLNGWQGTDATVQSGVHTCLEMPTGAQGAAPADRSGPFELTIDAFHGQEHWGDTIKFAGHQTRIRPPTRIMPVDENRAIVVVAQQPGEVAMVWVYEESESGRQKDNGPIGCGSPPPQVAANAVRVNPFAIPKSFPEADMNSADWPWDRSFSQYTIWSLNLKHSEDYTLCVDLAQEGQTEEWALQTPDGVVLRMDDGMFRYFADVEKGSLGVTMLGVERCFVVSPVLRPGDVFPGDHLVGTGSTYNNTQDGPRCDSDNGFVGPEIVLRAGIQHDANTYGILRVPTQVLVTQCGPANSSSPGVALSVEGPPCDSSLNWYQRTLCGPNPFSDCGAAVLYSLDISFEAFIDTSNGRPDPRDWGISLLPDRLENPNDPAPSP